MTINIRAVGMELTPAIRQYVEEKMMDLEKFATHTLQIMQIDVEVGRDTNHHHKGDVHICSAKVDIPGDMLKIERSEEDLYKAIDKVRDHLRETLSQRKEKEVDARKAE